MNTMEKVRTWREVHHPLVLEILRIGLGLALFIKGILFIRDTDYIQSVLNGTPFELMSFYLVHFVAFAHLFGGVMIVLGLKTRVALWFQVPILIGAIFLNSMAGSFNFNSELAFAIIALCFTIFFLVYGSGHYSTDYYWRKYKEV